MTDAHRLRRRSAELVLRFGLTVVCLGGTGVQAQQACSLDRATGTTIDAKPFLSNAYGVQWNFATDRLAYMQPNAAGYYRIFTSRPDGLDARALTHDQPGLPNRHLGVPSWHASGRYILFAAQKQEWHSPRLFGSPDYEALPGFGTHDDLWVITADGSRFWKLTDEPNTKTEGELMPLFSADGRHIAWASRQPDKTYVLKVAEFVELPEPHLANIRSYLPGGKAYYETGAFSSDGRSLYFTSDQDTHNFWLSQIYRLDLATGKSTRLTRGVTYNEHPRVVPTPTGDWVVYMSTLNVRRRPMRWVLGTDWWAMRPDGSGLKRLTTMNANSSSNPEDEGKPLVACAVTPTPSGQFMLGDVQDSLVKQTGLVKVVRFTCN